MRKPLKELEIGTIYLIHNKDSGCHKIGITMNWSRRKRELEVGTKNIEIKTATVIKPLQIEQSLFRKYKAQRLPQTEYLQLSPIQVLEVIRVFDTEASKLQGDDVNLHLKYAALEYEIKKAGAHVPVEKLIELEKIKRQLYPEYNARVIAREAHREAQKKAEIQEKAQVALVRAKRKREKREENIEWNRRGRWWNAFFRTIFTFCFLSTVPIALNMVVFKNPNAVFLIYLAIAAFFMMWAVKTTKRRIDE